MSVEILAKLNPVGVHFGERPGGWNESSPLDIAAALGMGNLSDPAFFLALAKFCGDDKALPKIKALITDAWAPRIRYQRQSVLELSGLVSVAVDDVVDWHICDSCFGTGQGKRKPRKCWCCKGSGHRKTKDTELAAGAGLTLETFRRWQPTYQSITAELNAYIAEIERHLLRHYFGEAEVG